MSAAVRRRMRRKPHRFEQDEGQHRRLAEHAQAHPERAHPGAAGRQPMDAAQRQGGDHHRQRQGGGVGAEHRSTEQRRRQQPDQDKRPLQARHQRDRERHHRREKDEAGEPQQVEHARKIQVDEARQRQSRQVGKVWDRGITFRSGIRNKDGGRGYWGRRRRLRSRARIGLQHAREAGVFVVVERMERALVKLHVAVQRGGQQDALAAARIGDGGNNIAGQEPVRAKEMRRLVRPAQGRRKHDGEQTKERREHDECSDGPAG